MNIVARYIYKRPYDGSYAKNYIYIVDNNSMIVESLMYRKRTKLMKGERLLRNFKNSQLVVRSAYYSFNTAIVLGEIAKKHTNDKTIEGSFRINLDIH